MRCIHYGSWYWWSHWGAKARGPFYAYHSCLTCAESDRGHRYSRQHDKKINHNLSKTLELQCSAITANKTWEAVSQACLRPALQGLDGLESPINIILHLRIVVEMPAQETDDAQCPQCVFPAYRARTLPDWNGQHFEHLFGPSRLHSGSCMDHPHATAKKWVLNISVGLWRKTWRAQIHVSCI
jgi:hypothetical protein